MSEQICMDVDTALSEVPVNLFPLIDDTDFKTREESVTYDQAGLDLVWNFVTTAGAFSQTAVTPTTGGVYDWANQGNGMYSIEIPASGGGSINNDTEGYGWFTGYATGILPWRGPVICFRAAGLNNLLVDSAYSTTRGLSGTALPAAAADAAGGIPISDAGGLALDTQLANTHEITAARMGALTDLINGGRLDLIIDAIKLSTDNLPADPASETNVNANETKIDIIDTVVDAIKLSTDNLPADPASETNVNANETKIDTLLTRLTTLRAGYLDNLSAGAVALEATLTAIKGAGWTTETLKAISDAVAAIDVSGVADAVWNELLSGHIVAGSAGAALSTAGSGSSASDIAIAVWESLLADHITEDTMGYNQNLIDDIEEDSGTSETPSTITGTGYTLAQAQSHLSQWLAADTATAKGQSYEISGRRLTRADASTITKNIQFWQKEVARLSKGNGGGIRVRGATIIS